MTTRLVWYSNGYVIKVPGSYYLTKTGLRGRSYRLTTFQGGEGRFGKIPIFGFSPFPGFGQAMALLGVPYSVHLNNKHIKIVFQKELGTVGI